MYKKFKKVVDNNLKNKNHTKEIKAIIFDVGGVLLESSGKSVHEYIAKKLNIGLDEWFDVIEPYWEEMVKDESTTSYAMLKVSRHFNISKHKLEKILILAFKRNFRKNKVVFKIAKKLRKNYKTAILSDQLSLSYEAFEKYKLDRLVNVSVWSQKEGIRKPNIEIYKRVMQRLNVPAQYCLFIDNRDWNLVPAKNLKMKYILFYNHKQLLNQLKTFGVKI
jgi:putative hydrolase of the HAD superfamily